jgi:small subunit ribosomal protein S14
MAKKSSVIKNERRKKISARLYKVRLELKKIVSSPTASMEDKQAAQRKLNLMPRDASSIRVRNRCYLTGRPRGFYRRFGLCRLALRDKAHRGELPGVKKSSW